MLKRNDIIDYFFKGIKEKNNLRIGVEHEKFVLKKESFHQLSYDKVYKRGKFQFKLMSDFLSKKINQRELYKKIESHLDPII